MKATTIPSMPRVWPYEVAWAESSQSECTQRSTRNNANGLSETSELTVYRRKIPHRSNLLTSHSPDTHISTTHTRIMDPTVRARSLRGDTVTVCGLHHTLPTKANKPSSPKLERAPLPLLLGVPVAALTSRRFKTSPLHPGQTDEKTWSTNMQNSELATMPQFSLLPPTSDAAISRRRTAVHQHC